MSLRTSRRLLLTAACVGGFLAANVVSCTRKPSAIVVAIDSEGKIPKDIDSIQIEVDRGASTPFFETYSVVDGDAHLPGTITFQNDPSQDSTDPFTVRVTGSLGSVDATRVLRSATLGFAKEETRLLRMPLRYACYDLPEQCGDGETCKGGQCVPDSVDVTTLPTFDPSLVATTPAGATGCFDQETCFLPAVAITLTPQQLSTLATTCSIDPKSVGAAPGMSGAVNIAFQWNLPVLNSQGMPALDAQGNETFASTEGFTVLDVDPDEGWSPQGGVVTLSKGICSLVATGHIAAAQISTACAPKSSNQTLCVPPTGSNGTVVDAGTGGPDASSGADAGDMFDGGGSNKDGGGTGGGTLGTSACFSCLEKADCASLGINPQDAATQCALNCPDVCTANPALSSCMQACSAQFPGSSAAIAQVMTCVNDETTTVACASECVLETSGCSGVHAPDGGNGGAGGNSGTGSVPGLPPGLNETNSGATIQLAVSADGTALALLDVSGGAQIAYANFGPAMASVDGTMEVATAVVQSVFGKWSQSWPSDSTAAVGSTVELWIVLNNPPGTGFDITQSSATMPGQVMQFGGGSMMGMGGGGGAGGGSINDPCNYVGFYDVPPECVGVASTGVASCLGTTMQVQNALAQCQGTPGCGTLLIETLQTCGAGNASCIASTAQSACPNGATSAPILQKLLNAATPACVTTCEQVTLPGTPTAACNTTTGPLTDQCLACLSTSAPSGMVSACESVAGCEEELAEYFWLSSVCQSPGDSMCSGPAEAYSAALCGSSQSATIVAQILASPSALAPCFVPCTPPTAP